MAQSALTDFEYLSRGGCFCMLVYAKLFNFVSFYLVTFLQQTHPQLKLVFGMMPLGYHLLSCLKFIQTWYPKYTGLDFLQFIAYSLIIKTRKIVNRVFQLRVLTPSGQFANLQLMTGLSRDNFTRFSTRSPPPLSDYPHCVGTSALQLKIR